MPEENNMPNFNLPLIIVVICDPFQNAVLVFPFFNSIKPTQ